MSFPDDIPNDVLEAAFICTSGFFTAHRDLYIEDIARALLAEREVAAKIVASMAAKRRDMAQTERREGGDVAEVDALNAQGFILECAERAIMNHSRKPLDEQGKPA